MDTDETHRPAPRTLDRGEGRIAYEVTGTGPLVVCVPGMGELRSSYRHNVRALVDAGFRVATMDLRGHGDSDATFSSYDDVATAQDALALVEELGGPALVVGSSMGAGAAVWAAAERPDLVAGVALVGPFVRNPRSNPLMTALFRLLMAGPWAPAAWVSYLPSLYPGARPDDFEEHRALVRDSMRRPGRARAFRRTTRTSHAPAEARLGEVQAPALVVMGTADPDFGDAAAEARWIAEQLGDARLVLVRDAGHYPHTEQPEVVDPELVSFASEVLGRA